MKPTQEELKKILDAHAIWLQAKEAGKHADLCGANLRGANLCGANLRGANLRWANLRGADLRGADLCEANLRGANLRGANLCWANLRGANLRGANLRGANLRWADLRGADLRGANLRGADLRGADLCGANLRGANLCWANLCEANLCGAENAELAMAQTIIVPEGDLIGWKKVGNGSIVKLRIPAIAKRSNASGRKCRAEFVEVLEGEGYSDREGMTKYSVGLTVRCDKWCEDRWQECAGGIHFYITRAEAEAHQF